MADFIIILILLLLGGLALRSCLRKKKGGAGCPGSCGTCHGHCCKPGDPSQTTRIYTQKKINHE